MAKFQARIALFDNSAAQEENDMAPALTGKLEISESHIELLMDELLNAEIQTYGTRRFKVIDVAAWETDGSSNLKYSGKCRMPMKPNPAKAIKESAPVDNADELSDASLKAQAECEAAAGVTDVHGNPVNVEDF